MDGDNNADSERSKLKTAFEKLADTNGLFTKDRLQALARELGMHDTLTNSEIDDMWRQMEQNDDNMISFETFWKWWVSDIVFDYTKQHSLN
ncbi:unnamed protein product [Phytophthora fragariaefolia]|uniref:Unnamed protein product n=1 Tax=Phytophthora fragariaefolia TaxID=1490495 RepID=A0A9W6TRU6_9STRA|nr:unnamed protein product [Phytophthora fragariaefolia]